jgi:hypothetical protein
MSGQIKLRAASLGGDISLVPTDTASSVVVTIPAVTATVLTTATAGVPIGGPAFSAFLSSNQTVSVATDTKVALNTEVFDTNSNYNNATYRFTPTVAGYYQVNGSISFQGGQGILTIQKNGAAYQYQQVNTNATSGICTMTCLLFLNGSTDYIELYGYSTAGTVFAGGSAFTTFSASMIRSA